LYSVLLVDDSRFMRYWLTELLSHSEYQVVAEAGDGPEAIELFNILDPDITILDITLPYLGGIECLRTILSLKPSANVVMCSSLGHNYNIEEAFSIGAKEFFVKPNFEHLVEKLDKLTAAS